MDTRADFYVGIGPTAEWLGSVGWDGYEWAEDIHCDLMQSKTENHFRDAIADIADRRDDYTFPINGWPWPWDNSNTTDFAYCFVDGSVKIFNFGREWLDSEGEDVKPESDDTFPDMSSSKKVTLGPRSGLIVIQPKE